MQDYLKTQKIVAKYLYFYYRGKRFSGQGIIEWEPETGFEIDILLENPGLERIEGRGLRVSEFSDFCSIRVWTDDWGWALIPYIEMHNRELGLLGKHFSIRFSRMYFCKAGGDNRSANTHWTGNCLFRLKGRNQFSSNVAFPIYIQGQLLNLKTDGGFLYQENGYKVVGYFIDYELFYLTWRLPKSEYTKGQAWNWPIGFQEALQIWLGRTISLLKREMNRNSHKVVEFKREVESQSLGTFQLVASNSVQNEAIMMLAKFFCKEESHPEIEVCRNIFNQVVDASQQRSQAAQELLVATILEAIIRTLYNCPMSGQGNSRGLVQQRLNGQFKGTYFSKAWTPHCDLAIDAFERLRHRNAHPDWLETVGNSTAVERVRQAVDDMLYLCQFYGYMLLAMAGLRVENPCFPTPHQQWGPSFVISAPEDPVGLPPPPFPSEALNNLKSPFADLPEGSSRYAKMMAFRRHKASLRQPPTK